MKKNRLSIPMWISIGCYGFIIFSGLLFGILYVTNPDLLDYHLRAIGVTSMNEIPTSYRIMFQTFKRAAGFGFISNAVSMLILLVCQVKKGYPWSKWALFLVTAPYWYALFINVKKLEIHTNAGAPMFSTLIVASLSVIGFIAARVGSTNRRWINE